MFSLIRLILAVILFGGLYILIKKLKLIPKHRYLFISLILSVLTMVLLGLVPFENVFYTFESPQEVYKYSKNEGEIIEIISGKYSDFMIIDSGKSRSVFFAEKADDGWKLSGFLKNKRIKTGIGENYSVMIYQYDKTDDYFISVKYKGNSPAEISDNLNSNFIKIEKKSANSTATSYDYYAYLDGYNGNYELIINGEVIKLYNA